MVPRSMPTTVPSFGASSARAPAVRHATANTVPQSVIVIVAAAIYAYMVQLQVASSANLLATCATLPSFLELPVSVQRIELTSTQ